MNRNYELKVFDHIWIHLEAPIFSKEAFGEYQWDARRSFDDTADVLADRFREVLAKAESLRLSAHRLGGTLVSLGIDDAEVIGEATKAAITAHLAIADFLKGPVKLRPKIVWEADK